MFPHDSIVNILSLQNLTCPNATVINGTTDCVLGLGMTPQQYNLLYAIYAWTYANTHITIYCKRLMNDFSI